MKMSEEKIVIVRDYTGEYVEQEFTQEDARMAAEIERGRAEFCRRPHMIDPVAKASFDKTVDICDALAEDFFGKMIVTVERKYCKATIKLELKYVEFFSGFLMDQLHAIADAAISIRIFALPQEEFLMCLDMPYFVPKAQPCTEAKKEVY